MTWHSGTINSSAAGSTLTVNASGYSVWDGGTIGGTATKSTLYITNGASLTVTSVPAGLGHDVEILNGEVTFSTSLTFGLLFNNNASVRVATGGTLWLWGTGDLSTTHLRRNATSTGSFIFNDGGLIKRGGGGSMFSSDLSILNAGGTLQINSNYQDVALRLGEQNESTGGVSLLNNNNGTVILGSLNGGQRSQLTVSYGYRQESGLLTTNDAQATLFIGTGRSAVIAAGSVSVLSNQSTQLGTLGVNGRMDFSGGGELKIKVRGNDVGADALVVSGVGSVVTLGGTSSLKVVTINAPDRVRRYDFLFMSPESSPIDGVFASASIEGQGQINNHGKTANGKTYWVETGP